MTWLDLLTVALFVLVSFLETKRGAVPAIVDLAVVLLGIGLAKGLGMGAGGFLTVFLIMVGVAVLAGWLVDTYTKWDIGPYDSVLAGVLGAVTGLALAHGAFHAAVEAKGNLQGVAQASVLFGQVYELDTFHAIGQMLRNLGGGPTIVDKVREQQ